ncbi:bone morphogenetic protein 8A-like [Panulirus ornatus]|uniref:bone morphogenetic protein 8A-like n=1 Tax=Panulirus ornatus TaxID=150431 RepID=UPI003A83BD35
MWEVSLMIAREDQDACNSGGVSSRMEDTEEKSFPEEWNFALQRMRSRRGAKRNQDGRKNRGGTGRRMRKGRNGCRLRRMYVNFRDLGWNNWIIAPTGYEAGVCRGKCRFPFHALDSATNYALVMALRRQRQSKGDGACCVPSELEPLSLLYYDHASNVILKKHPEMVVMRCGCR